MGCICVAQLTGDASSVLTQCGAIPAGFQYCIWDIMMLILCLLCYTLLCNQNLKASIGICVKMQYGTLNQRESEKLKKRNDSQEHLETTEKRSILNGSTVHKVAADSVKVLHFMYL